MPVVSRVVRPPTHRPIGQRGATRAQRGLNTGAARASRWHLAGSRPFEHRAGATGAGTASRIRVCLGGGQATRSPRRTMTTSSPKPVCQYEGTSTSANGKTASRPSPMNLRMSPPCARPTPASASNYSFRRAVTSEPLRRSVKPVKPRRSKTRMLVWTPVPPRALQSTARSDASIWPPHHSSP